MPTEFITHSPDVAFGEHPDLGIVAAITDGLPNNPTPILDRAGWRHLPVLDIYLAPTDRRDDALDAVAVTTVQLRRHGCTVAVQPELAGAVLTRGTGTPGPVRALALAGGPARTARLADHLSTPPAAPASGTARIR
ncbi:hypothetical protein [Kitasatospora griseola]|uniref:hypothetical protein n=1 Tax=Kitasatospora griseola TaxID=2064 RepID=UPI0036543B24